jgi:hypothetical protein
MGTTDRVAPAGAGRIVRIFCLASSFLLMAVIPGPYPGRADDGAKKIESIRVETGVAGKVGVFFRLSEAFAPRCFSLVGEDRKLVCDFIGAGAAASVHQALNVESPLLFRVRVGRHIVPEFKTRVVLDMDRFQSYEVEQFFVKGKNEYVLVVQPLAKGAGP